MKALLICLSAVILQAGGCNTDGDTPDCPPCPECPPAQQDDGRMLEALPNAEEMVHHFRKADQDSVSRTFVNIDDLQTMINMCKREGRTKVTLYLGAFTDAAATEYLRSHNIPVTEENMRLTRNKPMVLIGTADRVYKVNTMICPPPASCGMDVDRTATR